MLSQKRAWPVSSFIMCLPGPHYCWSSIDFKTFELLIMWLYHWYFSSERAQRSRQHERGTSAERRYKRSHRRSPTSSNHRRQHRHRHHGGHGSGHTHRGHRDLAEHSRRSYSSSQVSFQQVSEAARTNLPRGFLQQIRYALQLLPQQRFHVHLIDTEEV